MTVEIPRFTDRLLAGELQESPLGAWVRYADHAAALAHTCAEREVACADRLEALRAQAQQDAVDRAVLQAVLEERAENDADYLALKKELFEDRDLERATAAEREARLVAEIEGLRAQRTADGRAWHRERDRVEGAEARLAAMLGRASCEDTLEEVVDRVVNAAGAWTGTLQRIARLVRPGVPWEDPGLEEAVTRYVEACETDGMALHQEMVRHMAAAQTATAERDTARAGLVQVSARLGGAPEATIEQILHNLDHALLYRKCEKRRADDADRVVDRLVGRLDHAESSPAEAQRATKRANEHADALVAKHTQELSERDRALEGALADLGMAHQEARKLAAEVASIKADLEQAQWSIKDYRVRACALAVQHDHDRREGASALERARAEVAILQVGERASQAEVADLRAQVVQAEGLIQRANTATAESEAYVAALRAEVGRLEKVVEERKEAAKYAYRNGREAMLQECVAALRQRAQDLRNGEPTYDTRAEHVESDAAYLQREVQP